MYPAASAAPVICPFLVNMSVPPKPGACATIVLSRRLPYTTYRCVVTKTQLMITVSVPQDARKAIGRDIVARIDCAEQCYL
jgi:hypothetical protein